MTQLIEPFQQFNVAFQAVDKGAVEHMPANLSQTRLRAPCWPVQRTFYFDTARIAADPDHQHPIRAQVQRRADRR